MSLRLQAELRVRLHVDLKGVAELVELVDIARADIGRSVENTSPTLTSSVSALRAVDRRPEAAARRRGRWCSAAAAPDWALPSSTIGLGRRSAAWRSRSCRRAAHLHGEAAGVADALDRRRHEHQARRASCSLSSAPCRFGVQRAAGPAPLPGRAGSSPSGSRRRRRRWRARRCCRAAEMPPMVDHLVDARESRARSCVTSSITCCGALQRGAVRQLHADHARSPGPRSG